MKRRSNNARWLAWALGLAGTACVDTAGTDGGQSVTAPDGGEDATAALDTSAAGPDTLAGTDGATTAETAPPPADSLQASDQGAEQDAGAAVDGAAVADAGTTDASAPPTDAGVAVDTATAADTAAADLGSAPDANPVGDAGALDAVQAGDTVVADSTQAVDAGPACVPTNPSTESCDGKDNDCDGKTDEDTCADSPCAASSCVAAPAGGFACALFPKQGPCDDGNACTTGDSCANGLCQPGTPTPCNDGNACTDDACKAGLCAFTPNAAPCDDGNACTSGDQCAVGACKAGIAKLCDDNDACTADSCDPKTGKCVNSAGSTCGACKLGDNAACGADSWCAAPKPGVCSGLGGCTKLVTVCTKEYAPVCGCNGTTYGNPCMAGAAGVNIATSGACKPTLCAAGAVCDDKNVCTTDTCDAATGKCVFSPNSNACDDGNACTAGEICAAGVCKPGAAKTCSDGDSCTADLCDPATGKCVFKPMPDCGGCKIGDNLSCPKGQWCVSPAVGMCVGVGSCAPLADILCPMIYKPVCGCDGKTYGNSCTATAVGMNVASQGECKPTGCLGVNCDDGNVCTSDSCDAATGKCLNATNALGCDDGNPCTAPDVCVAGVCKAGAAKTCNDNDACTQDSCDGASGQCVYAPIAGCAGCKIGDPLACGKSFYCAGPAGVCSGSGKCTNKPTICPDVVQPVCGCDGNTYGNSCEAAAMGVNVVASGACKAKTCGGLLGVVCPAGEVCDISGCGADLQGLCTAKPTEPCPKTTVDAQQCGCDGKTYPNSCFRLLAGVAKKSDGACPTTNACAVGDMTVCGATGFCKGSCGGKGLCAAKPAGCLTVFAPVCGCDNKTYSNECTANAAGQSVQYAGACNVSNGCLNVKCDDGNACTSDACDAATGTCVFKPLPDCTGAACTVGLATACGSAYWCNPGKPGVCIGTGTCAIKSKICPLGLIPVCGCDNVTYDGACQAAQAGFNVAYSGACKLIK